MATHRTIIDITDEEIETLDAILETIDTCITRYEDDWEETEEPLAGLLNQFSVLDSLKCRIELKVAP